MKKIITVQHPQSEQHTNGMIGSLGEWDLTDRGIAQAHRIGQNLLREIGDEPYVFYSSDLRRTKHTAEILSSYLHMEPQYTPLLREFDLGEANGKTKQWAKENNTCPVWPGTKDWAETVDGRVFACAETKREVAHRVAEFMEKIVAPTNENIIIVSHDGTLSIFFALWLGMDIEMLNRCNLSGKSGGVSILCEDAVGHRIVSRLNDMSFVQL
ncbi:MAG: histidine phosphatase family protein [Clostridia bacterium]|nr:histidine phosphatase family protein [Clostridia bacterium]